MTLNSISNALRNTNITHTLKLNPNQIHLTVNNKKYIFDIVVFMNYSDECRVMIMHNCIKGLNNPFSHPISKIFNNEKEITTYFIQAVKALENIVLE